MTTTWKVTLRTGPNTWSIITVDGATHIDAISSAQRLLGDFPVAEIV